MLFNSFPFIFVFLPVVSIIFYSFRHFEKHEKALDWLILCSLAFYAWGNPRNLPILIASLLFNYAVARTMGSLVESSDALDPNRRRRRLLVLGIACNLLLLSYFKYFSQLPLGISFFTLTQVMYLVDCYEGLISPSTLREHALFVSFFPTVTMGPILRAKDTIGQFRRFATNGPTGNQLASGTLLFSIGLFKKVVIADQFALIADAGYSSPTLLSMTEGWLTSVSFSLQLYYDFSGYSDMAVAVAMILGMRIPFNFNSPYQARSIVDFWRRWHISLSNFITTYLYTPIVRSFTRFTFVKAMWATFVSMVIVGLWHGSTWNFVIFGALHGLGLVTNQCWKKSKKKVPDAFAWLLTFAYVNLTFVFFRAPNLAEALSILQSLVNLNSVVSTSTLQAQIGSSTEILEMTLPLLLGVGMIFLKKNSNRIVTEFDPTWKNLIWGSLTFVASLVYVNSNIAKGFLYNDF